jgi:dipeptidyl aminopeptidase/acylaminoacyl peptidase
VDTGDRRLVAHNDVVPASEFVRDDATGRLVAVEFEPDLPTYAFLEPAHPLSRMLQGMLAARPDEHVELINATDDDGKALVRVYSDRDPGQYLVVDAARMSAETIGSVRPWIEPGQMAETSAFHIPASDGFRIHGYVTLPRRSPSAAAPPMVVLPHGGPHGVRDYWEFNPQVQLLASEGFAVLQVNFRGSGGYGSAYQEAGYRRWGSRVVQDIVDATRFAVRKGFADPTRICIYGASFGGYAAVQAAVLAPDLFRCAVGYAGIYDLTLLAKRGDIALRRSGRGYVRAVAGDDDATLQQQSPALHADQVKAQVMLIHGKRDQRAPIEHAEALRDALTARGHPPEWIVEPKEAHGFYDEGARERMYTRMVRFLKENTGPQAVIGATAPAR